MLNEEKIQLMAKLSMYEEQTGKKALSSNKYFQNDYIAMQMIYTGLSVSFAYFLCIALWVVYKVDYFMDELMNIDLMRLVQQILIIYIVVLLIYSLISYVVYSLKIRHMQEGNRDYAQNLKTLYLIEKRENRQKPEREHIAGGEEADDEDFSF